MKYTDKTEISKQEYYMLIGLLALGAHHMRSIETINLAIAKILGEKPNDGHSEDAVFGDYTADKLLEKSGIKVSENDNT